MNDVFSIECTNFPFVLDENKIIYVEREYEWYINQYIGRNRTRFANAFSNFNYEFCYLPVRMEPELVHVVSHILLATHEVNRALCKFAYMDGEKAVFYCLELDNDEKEESLAKQFYHFACWCKVDEERQAKWKQFDEEVDELRKEDELNGCWQRNTGRPHVQIINDIDGLEQLEECFDIVEGAEEGEVSYTEMQLRDLKRMVEELRKSGVSDERIREALDPEPEISRIEITSDYHIMLPELNKEIELKPITKAVFLLFLRHPDGINFKNLVEYSGELTELYLAVTDRVDPKVIHRTIESICSPLNNSIHEKCTLIREALTRCLGPRLAPAYCISGKRGENKRINIPESFVTWMAKLPA